MTKFDFILEKWTISELLTLLNEGKFIKLPHQRPLKLKKNHAENFIDAAINTDLLSNFIFADLKSSLKRATNIEDKEFFGSYVNKGYEFSIEDCQHRIASLQSIFSNPDIDYFVGKFENKKEEFKNSSIPVLILKNTGRNELIRKFGMVNSGKTVTNDNLLWGIDNNFNQFIKSHFIADKKLIRLYKIKTDSDNIKRILYGNILKIIKICSYHDNIVTSQSTGAEPLMSFLKDDMEIINFTNIIDLFDVWYEMIIDNPVKHNFSTQSNLFFILHILYNNGVELKSENVNKILSKLSDTRLSAETRYNRILNIITNEK